MRLMSRWSFVRAFYYSVWTSWSLRMGIRGSVRRRCRTRTSIFILLCRSSSFWKLSPYSKLYAWVIEFLYLKGPVYHDLIVVVQILRRDQSYLLQCTSFVEWLSFIIWKDLCTTFYCCGADPAPGSEWSASVHKLCGSDWDLLWDLERDSLLECVSLVPALFPALLGIIIPAPWLGIIPALFAGLSRRFFSACHVCQVSLHFEWG
jgi:hypothetical protein